MADDVDVTPGTGKTVKSEDIGGKQHQWVIPAWGPAGTANRVDVATGKPLPIQVRSATGLIPFGEPTDAKSSATDTTSVAVIPLLKQLSASEQAIARLIVATGSTVTRQANATPYAASDAVSDNATAGSVTAGTVTLSDTNDDPIAVETIVLHSTDTGVAGKRFTAWLYQSDPTASTGIVGGDNVAFSTKKGTFIGKMTGTFSTFSDGSAGELVPENGGRIIYKPTSGAKTLFYLLQTLDAFTPSANSTTFIPTFTGYQGRA